MRRLTSNPKDFGRVAVLMGGWSAERQVSLWSGDGVLQALKRRGVDAVGIDADKGTLLQLGKQGYDRVFNVLHGTGGEDGTVQAVLDLQGIPYTGSGVLASALAMDKLRSKRMWKAEGLPTPDWMTLREPADALRAAEQFGYPLFIKPADEGSSVGISKVKHATQLGSAFRRAAGDFEGRPRAVMAERFVAGGDYTCGILDGQPLPLIRIEPEGEFYDYHAKYISDRTNYVCPAGLDPLHEAELAAMCARAFELVGGRGWGRVDFMLDAQGKAWLLEVNTIPGMTSHSLVPMAARANGMDYESLCWAVLETTLGETA
ncbi:MAG TPA: D-alanine--D-alanine ligase [Nevskia sp.]|nr:D-alanine--D-alanine ligase [Nevskia sp.]